MKIEKGLLSNTGDGLDVEEMIVDIEKTFHINFSDDVFKNVKTYQDFEDLVISKIDGEISYDCTSQQAYYKLKSIICIQLGINKTNLYPSTLLKELFPKKNRIQNIKRLIKEIKPSFQILTLNALQTIILLVIFLIAIIFLYVNIWYSIPLFIVGFLFTKAFKSDTFHYNTLGELAEQLKIEDYKNSRRNRKSYNPKEVQFVIKSIFAEKLSLDFDNVKPQSIL